MQIINKILEEIKKQEVTIASLVYSFIGILFVRFILESLSSPTYTGIITSDPYTLIHYTLYFLTVTIGTAFIFGYFIDDYKNSLKIMLFGLPLIWLAPIIDILVSQGRGFKMMYLFDNGINLIFDFFTFFGPNLTFGATIGIRVGIFISLIAIGFLVYLKNKSLKKVFISVLSIYTFIFIAFSLPSVIYMFSNLESFNDKNIDIVKYFEKIILESTISHNTLREGSSSVSAVRFLELGFDKLMSQILFIISFFIGLVISWKISPKKFISIIKNSRPERVVSYLSLLICGSGYAYINGMTSKIVWIDFLGLFCLIISWFCLWMHAVHTNDVVDIDIDKISNKNRPLVNGDLSSKEMSDVGLLWLISALVGSWCAGFYPFFMSIVYISSYMIYSSYPLRLRRFPIISSFLIGIAGLSTIQAGFFFASVSKEVQAFPIFLSMGIITMITLAINTKDMKDVDGDRASGIMTIPTMFPKNGPKIVGLCFALSFLLVPIFLKLYIMYIFTIPIAIIGYKFVNKKPYKEEPLFIVRFSFLSLVVLTYISLLWFADVYNLV